MNTTNILGPSPVDVKAFEEGLAKSFAAMSGSASVGRAQHLAAEIWEQFKTHELTYADMLELCAVLLVNVADKSESRDAEIVGWTHKLVADMRTNAAQKMRSKDSATKSP